MLLVRLVLDQSDDHAVQVEEEHDEVETQFNKGFLHVVLATAPSKQPLDSWRRTFLWTLSFRKISVASRRCVFSTILEGG